jgi:hypothetical protein
LELALRVDLVAGHPKELGVFVLASESQRLLHGERAQRIADHPMLHFGFKVVQGNLGIDFHG